MLPKSATAARMEMMISIGAISSHGVRAVLLSTVAREASLSTPGKFYKRSQEKNSFPAAGFLVGFQPTSWSRIVVAFRSVLSGRCAQSRRGSGFACQRFSSRLRDEASLFGDHKQHGCQVPTMVLLGTHGP